MFCWWIVASQHCELLSGRICSSRSLPLLPGYYRMPGYIIARHSLLSHDQPGILVSSGVLLDLFGSLPFPLHNARCPGGGLIVPRYVPSSSFVHRRSRSNPRELLGFSFRSEPTPDWSQMATIPKRFRVSTRPVVLLVTPSMTSFVAGSFSRGEFCHEMGGEVFKRKCEVRCTSEAGLSYRVSNSGWLG